MASTASNSFSHNVQGDEAERLRQVDFVVEESAEQQTQSGQVKEQIADQSAHFGATHNSSERERELLSTPAEKARAYGLRWAVNGSTRGIQPSTKAVKNMPDETRRVLTK